MINAVRIGTFLAVITGLAFMLLDVNPVQDVEIAGRAYRAGDMDQTLRLASRALGLSWLGDLPEADRIRAHELRARAAVRLGRPDFALSELDRALAAGPARAGVLMLRGELRLASGDAAGAVTDLDKGIELAGSRPPASALVHRGSALLSLGKTGDAWRDAVSAVKRDPSLPSARYLASRVLDARGRPDLALEQAEIGLKLLGQRPGLLFRRDNQDAEEMIGWVVELRMKNKVDPLKPSR